MWGSGRGLWGSRQGGKKARSRVYLSSRGRGEMTLSRRSGWWKNLSHLSPIAGGTRGRRKRNLGGSAPAGASMAHRGFTLAGGWQARTRLSPWHDALRRFYSELSGCEVSPRAAITATESTWPQQVLDPGLAPSPVPSLAMGCPVHPLALGSAAHTLGMGK